MCYKPKKKNLLSDWRVRETDTFPPENAKSDKVKKL